jgi:uncharacterized small protein (DUF1192 family)
MKDEEEYRVRRLVGHEIGQKLDDLSVADLDERIAVLRSEIERLESAKAVKNAARDAAGSIFRL